MWVDMQVNSHLKLAMRDVDSEIASVRQESRSALDLARRQEGFGASFERLVTSVEEKIRHETADLHKQTLASIEGLLQTVEELKQTVSHQERNALHRENTFVQEQHAEIIEMRRLHRENDKLHKALQQQHQLALAEFRHLQSEHKHELESLMEDKRKLDQQQHQLELAEIHRFQNEHKSGMEILMEDKRKLDEMLSGRGIKAWGNEQERKVLTLGRELSEQEKLQKQQLANLQREIRGHIESQLGAFRSELSSIAKQSDLDEIERRFEKTQRRLGEDLLAHQQKQISELRSETTAMAKKEAALVRALDEQLWLCDQRLGQRMDSVQQSCLDCARGVDDVMRSYDDIRRRHEESLLAIRELAQTHIRRTRSRSPEHTQIGSLEKCSPAFGSSHSRADREPLTNRNVDGIWSRSPRRTDDVLISPRQKGQTLVSPRKTDDMLISPRQKSQTLVEEIESEVTRDTKGSFFGRGLRRIAEVS